MKTINQLIISNSNYAAPAGRVLIAFMFVMSGLNKMNNYSNTAGWMDYVKSTQKPQTKLSHPPNPAAKRLPQNRKTAKGQPHTQLLHIKIPTSQSWDSKKLVGFCFWLWGLGLGFRPCCKRLVLALDFWGQRGIEPRTTRTQSEYHTSRPQTPCAKSAREGVEKRTIYKEGYKIGQGGVRG